MTGPADPRSHPRAAFEGLGPPVVVAFSGGADSVALLALAAGAGLEPLAVHVDHGLRAGSAAEAEAAVATAEGLGTRIVVVEVDVGAGPNLEARARAARYRALEGVRAAEGATAVLTGHTMDDQAETVVLNLLRGSGSAGLAAMAPRRGTLVRPLLGLRRSETHEICRRLGVEPVADPMNLDRAYRRVRVRREVLPVLSEVAERDLVPVLSRQAAVLRDESEFLDRLAAEASARIGAPGGGLSARGLAGEDPVVARRVIRLWLGPPPPSEAEVGRVLAVARGDARAAEVAPGRRVARSGGRLSVTDVPGAGGRWETAGPGGLPCPG